jgi:GT2 family glycosyltransferase
VLKVTIVSLIYQSPEYAREFYKSILWSTPEIAEGVADFFFVANNANPQTLNALRDGAIPHYELNLPVLSDEEHSSLGFGSPEYLGRVYAAYNYAISKSKTDLILLLNSDMVMSKDWLPNMLSVHSDELALSPTLVERAHPRFGVYPGATEANFGSSFKNFRLNEWVKFSSQGTIPKVIEKSELPFMPTLVRKKWFDELGGYPHGNIQGSEGYKSVSKYGDQYFFEKLKEYGVVHKSVEGVFCYHFKEGERESNILTFIRNILVPSVIRPAIRSAVRIVKKFLP